jgi:integrase
MTQADEKKVASRNGAEIEKWPSDCLRHTFASMHFAHFKNASETAHELGHADLKMLYRHYRERVKPAEAALFWEIRAQRSC